MRDENGSYLVTGRFLVLLPPALASVESEAMLVVKVADANDGAAPPVIEAVAAASPGEGAVAGDLSIAHKRTDCRNDRDQRERERGEMGE